MQNSEETFLPGSIDPYNWNSAFVFPRDFLICRIRSEINAIVRFISNLKVGVFVTSKLPV